MSHSLAAMSEYRSKEEQILSFEAKLMRAREIASIGDVGKIVETLKNEALLELCILETKRLFEKAVERIALTPKEWELFMVLWLHDEETAGHCVMTYRIAEEKVERELAYGFRFKTFYDLEQVTLDQFYRACLFHDIGKAAIPRKLLGNNVSEETCSHLICVKFREMRDHTPQSDTLNIESLPSEIIELVSRAGGDGLLDEDEVRKALKNHRPHDLPVSILYDAPDLEEIENFVKKYSHLALSRNSPLSAFIAVHPRIAGEILEQHGMRTPATLAQYHHSGKAETDAGLSSISGGSLEVFSKMSALENVLKFSDIIQALSDARPYKKSFPLLKSLSILIDEVEKGKLDAIVSYFIIVDEYNVRLSEITKQRDRTLDEQRQLKRIQDFITAGEKSAKTFVQSRHTERFQRVA